jgi:hypothetical protein
MYRSDIAGIPEEGDVNIPPPPAPQEQEGRLEGRKVRVKAKKSEKIPEPPKVPLGSSGKRIKGTRAVSSRTQKTAKQGTALASSSGIISRQRLSRTQAKELEEKASRGEGGPEILALRRSRIGTTGRGKISQSKQTEESALLAPQVGDTAQVFAAPRVRPLSLQQFQKHVQFVLTSPLMGGLTQDILDNVLQEGDQQIRILIDKKKFLEAGQLTEKLLKIGSATQRIKTHMLHVLLRTGNRQGVMLYAARLLKDPSCSEEFKVSLCQRLFVFCFRNCDFPQSIEFSEQLVQILDQKPDLASQYDRAAILHNINLAKERLAKYSAVNDTRTPGSPISGLSRSHYELLQLLQDTQQLTEDQIDSCDDFLAFCLGNKALSKTLREMSKIPTLFEVFQTSFLPTELIGTSMAPVGSMQKAGASTTSVKQLDLAKIAKELSVLSYKTQEENIEKYMKAMGKLSAILDKIDQRQDLQAFTGLVQSFQDPEVAPIFGPSIAQVYSQEQIDQAQQELAARRAAIEDTVIAQSDKLTGADLTALNSLINLKETLESYRNDGLLASNAFVSIIIERGKQAEALVGRLIELLGSSYQTGDLSFRNLRKFDALTGKSQGWMMNLYSLITPFSHAAMIDQTMDLQTIAYSEVLNKYIYRTVPLEEFLTTDLYRVNIPSLISSEGRALLSARLESLISQGLASPLLTVDQLIQSTFNAHLEGILSGTTEIPWAIEMPTKNPGDIDEEIGKLQRSLADMLPPKKIDAAESTQEQEELTQAWGKYAQASDEINKRISELEHEKADLVQAWKEFETQSAEIETQRMEIVEEYHRTTFGTIENDGMLQLRAVITPVHRPVNLPWQSTPQGLDFKSINFEGQMICSQFQALALLKALALTRESLYEMMAEQIARGPGGLAPTEDVPMSKASSEEIGETAEPAKSVEQQAAFSAALQQVKQMNLFTIPVSELEKPHLLSPSRVISLFREHLVPVTMAPVAREILDLPEQFYGTALFGS